MSSVGIALLMIGLVLLLIFMGARIAVALLAVSVLGSWLITGDFFAAATGILGMGPFYVTFNYSLAVIPLFLLMGIFVNGSGTSKDLYEAAFYWFGRLPGGLGLVTVISNALFAALTGVSIASATVFSKIAVPQMIDFGYEKRFSVGCVAGTSVLGMLIPPSILLVVYGIVASESIGKLFIAGIVPGLLLALTYSLLIIFIVYFFPKIIGKPSLPEKVGWKFRLKALSKVTWTVGLIVLILGGMYGGIFTPTEAGAIGCTGALVIMILRSRLRIKEFIEMLMEGALTTASVFLLFIGAQMFARMLTLSGLVTEISQFMATLNVPPLLVVAGMMLILMVLGTFLDIISIMLITMPIFLPVVNVLGFDLIWFGVLATISIETGIMTPPFGMVVFVVKSTLGDLVSLEDIYIGSLPFLLTLFLTIAILLFFPKISTWLPSFL